MLGGMVKRYPRYRDSGVEWLGEVPAHWQVSRLKFAAPVRSSKLAVAPSDQTFVGLENIEPHTGRLLLGAAPTDPESVVGWFAAGDVLVGKLRPYLAKVVRPAFDGISTTELVALQPTACSQGFLFYALLNTSFTRWLDSLTFGSKMPRASPEQIANTFIPVPPEGEQQAITDFLDRETERIDALVKRKERRVDLLKERRTAIINRSVTRGLVADVAMKDTDVEWLGEIPAHWQVNRLKFVAPVRSSKVASAPPGQILVGLENIESHTGRLLLNRDPIEPESVVGWFAAGDVLVGKLRPYLAKVARPVFNGISTTELVALQPLACSQGYLFYALLNTSFIHWLDSLTFGSKMPRVNPEQIANTFVPMPPEGEQQAITDFLDRETTKIDALVAKVQETIECLKEYRLALISAAVTGNIDVRRQALREIPALSSSREGAWRYLGFKHVNGPAKWGSYAKSKYIAGVHRDYNVPLDDIARQIGDTHNTVRRLYRGLMVIEQAERVGAYDRRDRWRGHFAFSHLYVGLQSSGISAFLDLRPVSEEDEEPVPTHKKNELRELLVWMYGSRSEQKPPVVQSQNPHLRQLGDVLANAEALAVMRAGAELSVAFEVSRPSSNLFEEALVGAKRNLEKAHSTLSTGYRASDALLAIASDVMDLSYDLHDEMQRKSRPRSRRRGSPT